MRCLFALAGCVAFAIAAPASGQSLRDRLEHVRLGHEPTPSTAPKIRDRDTIRRVLERPITLDVHDVPLRDVLGHIAVTTGIDMVPHYRTDRRIGLEPDTPITVSAAATPARVVLEIVLEQCDDRFDECTWQIRQGFLEVGTKDRLASRRAQETRYYPIHDLLAQAPDYDNAPAFKMTEALSQGRDGGAGHQGSLVGTPDDFVLPRTPQTRTEQIVDVIRTTIEPDGWRAVGGRWATIREYQGVLIVRAPEFIHRQIRAR